jgi:hypothetical protein
MNTSHHTHRPMGDTRFFLALTAVHAAIAFPALYLWAAVCDRARLSSR